MFLLFPLILASVVLTAVPSTAQAAGHASTSAAARHSSGHRSTYAHGVPRDKHGHIARSPKAKSEFRQGHPCPSTGKTSGACPGYVIDHVKPLKRGGPDAPSNMQWQTKDAAREKDRTE